jgi:hypothetical protein
MLNIQLMLLSASSTYEIMSGTGIKHNDNGASVQGEHTSEDLLTLRNILQGGVVDAASLGNGHLLGTTWWMGDVAMCGILLWHSALSSEVARATTVEASVVGGSPSGG